MPGVPRRRTEPSAARIMLVDGPGLLGWGAPARAGRRVVGTAPCRGAGRSRRARGAGAQPVEPLARLLSGAMNEHAMWLAEPGTAHGERLGAGADRERPGASDPGPARNRRPAGRTHDGVAVGRPDRGARVTGARRGPRSTGYSTGSASAPDPTTPPKTPPVAPTCAAAYR
ncbi:hypothetical protein [Pseudonocardia alni]|uniref:hypothetical protein n=1 Tax=Pseudonocardia alni TaxID=33907 RepID=UPI00340D8499